jgi:hypothetical protein
MPSQDEVGIDVAQAQTEDGTRNPLEADAAAVEAAQRALDAAEAKGVCPTCGRYTGPVYSMPQWPVTIQPIPVYPNPNTTGAPPVKPRDAWI